MMVALMVVLMVDTTALLMVALMVETMASL
jgi:hypothetical protein